jgi:hypothetical protein
MTPKTLSAQKVRAGIAAVRSEWLGPNLPSYKGDGASAVDSKPTAGPHPIKGSFAVRCDLASESSSQRSLLSSCEQRGQVLIAGRLERVLP